MLNIIYVKCFLYIIFSFCQKFARFESGCYWTGNSPGGGGLGLKKEFGRTLMYNGVHAAKKRECMLEGNGGDRRIAGV